MVKFSESMEEQVFFENVINLNIPGKSGSTMDFKMYEEVGVFYCIVIYYDRRRRAKSISQDLVPTTIT